MKKIYQATSFLLIAFTILALFGCSAHQHSYAEANCTQPAICTECSERDGETLGHMVSVGICERCGEVQGEDSIATLNTGFAVAMESGSALIDCIESIQNMTPDEQYKVFIEADGYTTEMLAAYEDVLDACGDTPELERIVYQVRLLENSCPKPVKGNDVSALVNQSLLYQLYLRQVSSSFAFLAEDMAHLIGAADTPNPVSYFNELPEMPTPDSVIYGIEYISRKDAGSDIQYTYILGANEDDANADYNLYIRAIDMTKNLETEIMEQYTAVTSDGEMAAIMAAGSDTSLGYFLIISFPDH